jgi:hypothetical protein
MISGQELKFLFPMSIERFISTLIFKKANFKSWAPWYTPVIPALGKLRQKNQVLLFTLGCTITSSLKTTK